MTQAFIKKSTALLLALCLVLGLVPSLGLTARAEDGGESGGGIDEAKRTAALLITDTTPSEENASQGWEWNAGTRTLTLNDLDLETAAPTALKVPGGTTIVLSGRNSIKSTYIDNGDSYGIYVPYSNSEPYGDQLLITGGGSLDVEVSNTTDVGRICAIYVHSEMAVVGGAAVTAKTPATIGEAVYAEALTVAHATLTAQGGTEAIVTGSDYDDDGDYGPMIAAVGFNAKIAGSANYSGSDSGTVSFEQDSAASRIKVDSALAKYVKLSSAAATTSKPTYEMWLAEDARSSSSIMRMNRAIFANGQSIKLVEDTESLYKDAPQAALFFNETEKFTRGYSWGRDELIFAGSLDAPVNTGSGMTIESEYGFTGVIDTGFARSGNRDSAKLTGPVTFTASGAAGEDHLAVMYAFKGMPDAVANSLTILPGGKAGTRNGDTEANFSGKIAMSGVYNVDGLKNRQVNIPDALDEQTDLQLLYFIPPAVDDVVAAAANDTIAAAAVNNIRCANAINYDLTYLLGVDGSNIVITEIITPPEPGQYYTAKDIWGSAIPAAMLSANYSSGTATFTLTAPEGTYWDKDAMTLTATGGTRGDVTVGESVADSGDNRKLTVKVTGVASSSTAVELSGLHLSSATLASGLVSVPFYSTSSQAAALNIVTIGGDKTVGAPKNNAGFAYTATNAPASQSISVQGRHLVGTSLHSSHGQSYTIGGVWLTYGGVATHASLAPRRGTTAEKPVNTHYTPLTGSTGGNFMYRGPANQQTTYSNAGWELNIHGADSGLKQWITSLPLIVEGGEPVTEVSFFFFNPTENDLTVRGISMDSDVQIGSDDYAPITPIKRGSDIYGFTMEERAGNAGTFALINANTARFDAEHANNWWGVYNSRSSHRDNESTISTEPLTDIDSGAVARVRNIKVPAGELRKYSFYIGAADQAIIDLAIDRAVEESSDSDSMTPPTRTEPLDLTGMTGPGPYGDEAEGWAWDYEHNTLTLDGLRLDADSSPALVLPAGTTIVVTDGSRNRITTTTDSAIGDTTAIDTTGTLAINSTGTGGGTFNVKATNTNGSNTGNVTGIKTGDLAVSHVKSKVTVDSAAGGAVKGIDASGTVAIANGSDVTVQVISDGCTAITGVDAGGNAGVDDSRFVVRVNNGGNGPATGVNVGGAGSMNVTDGASVDVGVSSTGGDTIGINVPGGSLTTSATTGDKNTVVVSVGNTGTGTTQNITGINLSNDASIVNADITVDVTSDKGGSVTGIQTGAGSGDTYNNATVNVNVSGNNSTNVTGIDAGGTVTVNSGSNVTGSAENGSGTGGATGVNTTGNITVVDGRLNGTGNTTASGAANGTGIKTGGDLAVGETGNVVADGDSKAVDVTGGITVHTDNDAEIEVDGGVVGDASGIIGDENFVSISSAKAVLVADSAVTITGKSSESLPGGQALTIKVTGDSFTGAVGTQLTTNVTGVRARVTGVTTGSDGAQIVTVALQGTPTNAANGSNVVVTLPAGSMTSGAEMKTRGNSNVTWSIARGSNDARPELDLTATGSNPLSIVDGFGNSSTATVDLATDTVESPGEGWAWRPTGTVTVDGKPYTGPVLVLDSANITKGIKVPDGTTIVLKAGSDNRVIGNGQPAIESTGGLTIAGSGSLRADSSNNNHPAIKGGNVTLNVAEPGSLMAIGWGPGVEAAGNLTIGGSGSLLLGDDDGGNAVSIGGSLILTSDDLVILGMSNGGYTGIDTNGITKDKLNGYYGLEIGTRTATDTMPRNPIEGAAGKPLEFTDTVQITLHGDTPTGLRTGDALDTNVPGVKAVVKQVANGHFTFVLEGTPSAGSSGAIKITIPGSKLASGKDYTVTTGGQWNIIGSTFVEDTEDDTPADGGVQVSTGGGSSTGLGTVTQSDDQTETVVSFTQEEIGGQVDAAGSGDPLTIAVPAETDSVTVQLVVRNVEDMAEKDMVLMVTVGDITYKMPANALDTDAIAQSLGYSDSSEAVVNVTIVQSTDTATLEAARAAVSPFGGQLVLPPVVFDVTITYGGRTYKVDRFDQYVSRIIEITADQAASITTAVIIEDDGSVRHVPTEVFGQSGKHYAKINALTNSVYVLIFNQQGFNDTAGRWYAEIVGEMASRKIVNGVSDTEFAGDRAITRAEFAAIVIRALGLPASGGPAAFGDVAGTAWYAGSVNTAFAYGIVSGRGEGVFDPMASITREEAMLMVQRAATVAGFEGRRGDIDSFGDAEAVKAWAKDAVVFNVATGLIVGDDENNLRPGDNISRAETATVLLRLLQKAGLVDVRAEA